MSCIHIAVLGTYSCQTCFPFWFLFLIWWESVCKTMQ